MAPASASSWRCNSNTYGGAISSTTSHVGPNTPGYCSVSPYSPCTTAASMYGSQGTCSSGNCLSLSFNTQSFSCCYCPPGQYMKPTNGGTATYLSSNCLTCPKGSYTRGPLGNFFQNSYYGSGCMACPPGTYADTIGSSVCTACPQGKTSFASNYWYSSTNGGTNSYTINLGATDISQCVDLPIEGSLALVKGATTTTVSLAYGEANSIQSSTTYTYQSWCSTFGQILNPSVGQATSAPWNTDSQCIACVRPTPPSIMLGATPIFNQSRPMWEATRLARVRKRTFMARKSTLASREIAKSLNLMLQVGFCSCFTIQISRLQLACLSAPRAPNRL